GRGGASQVCHKSERRTAVPMALPRIVPFSRKGGEPPGGPRRRRRPWIFAAIPMLRGDDAEASTVCGQPSQGAAGRREESRLSERPHHPCRRRVEARRRLI